MAWEYIGMGTELDRGIGEFNTSVRNVVAELNTRAEAYFAAHKDSPEKVLPYFADP